MKLTIAVQMDYDTGHRDPALLAIAPATTTGQRVEASNLDAGDACLHWLQPDSDGCARVWATPQGARLSLRYVATVSLHRRARALDRLGATPMHALPGDVLAYLRPSRYCPSDLFADFAADSFGTLEGGPKIAAMAAWIAREIAYVPGSSDTTTTALETCANRQGVCRDFVHVLCSLARAAGIPARYTTGYGPDVSPPDFHAVAEIWLGGGWQIVDPTGMSTAETLAIIASGRDAADTAFMETANWAQCVSQSVQVRAQQVS